MQKVDKDRPWAEFQIDVPQEAHALVQVAARTTVGGGRSTLFWEDRWINGLRICEITPDVYNKIPRRIRRSRLVADAPVESNWAGDIGPDITQATLGQFLRLWPLITAWQLMDGVEDSVAWAWEANGNFSSRSVYAARFMGLELSSVASFT